MKPRSLWQRLVKAILVLGAAIVAIPVLLAAYLYIDLAPKRYCNPPAVTQADAVEIAREYFLSRSLAKLKVGMRAERAEAERMSRAGLTEDIYREVFERAVENRGRYVDGKKCGYPLIYFEVRRSYNYEGFNGFNIAFTRIVPDGKSGWPTTTTGVTITSCGEFGGFDGTTKSLLRENCDRLSPEGPGIQQCP
ncbi:hypothetical protein [Pseudorhodoplanes sp.]|uniref:hypothetical protein n=1 Tax=Pseudorhodoplanes sp. TaxID=1934341 RepID=UPI002C51D01C|nr:hypothetical protein [Pseudorhodoplanes sp.]HWV51693.1 hypothetical protein [Pseudorhodoplanes sp.]